MSAAGDLWSNAAPWRWLVSGALIATVLVVYLEVTPTYHPATKAQTASYDSAAQRAASGDAASIPPPPQRPASAPLPAAAPVSAPTPPQVLASKPAPVAAPPPSGAAPVAAPTPSASSSPVIKPVAPDTSVQG